jgi:hypothetical protein
MSKIYSNFNQEQKEKILQKTVSAKYETPGILYNYLAMLYYRLRIKFVKNPELESATCLIKCRIDKDVCSNYCLKKINHRDYNYVFKLKINDLEYFTQTNKKNELIIFPREFVEINLGTIACTIFSFDVLYGTATKLLSNYGNDAICKSKLYQLFRDSDSSGYTKISDIEEMIRLNINCIDLGLPEIIEIKNSYDNDINIIDWYEPYNPLNSDYYQEQALLLYKQYISIKNNKPDQLNINDSKILYEKYRNDAGFLKFLNEKYKK